MLINGTDRSLYYDRESCEILDDLNEMPNTLSFECFGFTPANNQIVRVVVGATKEFEGTIASVSEYHDRLNGRTVYRVSAIDYTRDFDALLVTKAYGSQSATTTAQDIVSNFTSGFTQVHIAAGLPTVAAIQFKMTRPSSALRQLCDAFGGDAYVDYDKDVHVFTTETDIAPDPIATSTTSSHWRNFRYSQMIERVANRIFVEGTGSIAAADTAAGSTSLSVVSAAPFDASGGSVVTGNQVITYTAASDRVSSLAWQTQTPAFSVNWIAAAWSSSLGLFVAFAYNSTSMMTSPNGVTWTARTIAGLPSGFIDVIWADSISLFVAVSELGNIITSPDGINWTSRTPSVAGKSHDGVAWSPTLSLFAAVNQSGTAASAIMTSPDGITWTSRTAPSGKLWYRVTWAAALGLFVAVARDNTTATGVVMTSPDGITWTARNASTTGSWTSVAWSSSLGLLAAVGDVGVVMTSPDGITWTSRTAAEANPWYRVIWASGLEQFIAVSYTGTHRIMTSPDGIAWTSQTPPSDGHWAGLAWSPELRIAVAVADSSSGTVQVMTGTGTAYAVLTGIPTSGAGAIVNAINQVDEINLLVQRDDAASQATYGIRQAYIRDRRLSKAGAEARGDAELALRKDPYIEGSYLTDDTKVRSGRRVTVSMASEWGLSGTYTITKVRIYWVEGRTLPEREVTFSSNTGDNDLFRILRRLREQQATA